MYNAVYGQLGFPWEYRLMDCETPAEAKAFLAARDFLSVNITTPYKPEALAAATARAASAKLAHGANILVKKGDALIAFNTDGRGCVGYLERTGFSFDGTKVAVCGTAHGARHPPCCGNRGRFRGAFALARQGACTRGSRPVCG